MKKTDETILLLDGNALLHRAWHAIPPLTRRDGTVVNAVYGFAMTIEKMIEQFEPTYMAVAWDLPGKTFRHEKFEAYKAQRKKKEQELYDQIPMIQDLLEVWGIPSLSAEGYEADDVIGTLSKKAEKKDMKTLIVTGDLDALQLVDEMTDVIFFQKGISQTKTYDVDAVVERYKLTPDQLIDYKAFRGDTSDNIPGVSGVGEKTATMLVQEYGSVEEIFTKLDDLPEKYAKKLRGQEQHALDSKELVTIVTDIKLPFRFNDARVPEMDTEALLVFYREYEFSSLIRKHAGATPPPPMASTSKKGSSEITIVKTKAELCDALAQLEQKQVGCLLGMQAENLFGTTLGAIALSDGAKTVVVAHPSEELLAQVTEWLSRVHLLVTHDLKALMHTLDWKPTGAFLDVMIVSYLLHPGSRAHDVASLAKELLDETLPDVPDTYADDKSFGVLGRSTSLLPELAKEARAYIEENNMTRVLDEIELPLIPLLFEMESIGIAIDTKALNQFTTRLATRLEELTEAIHKAAGATFNINSTQQLAVVLFDDLGLSTKGIKKTKTGLSTAASELEKLRDEHEIIAFVEEYRELAKLKSTYAEALPKLVGEDGRIHTSFNQAVAATGRLSSSDPNLQNIPIRTELGNEIRKAFVAGRGKRLIAADYSQLELRLAAVIAKDKPFIEAFQEGADIHTRTAAEVFDLDEKKVTKQQRRDAKAVNFGILYGMGARALSRSTSLSFTEAKAFIERYFEIHHALRDYMDATKAKAHKDGWVETLFGRRRYFPEIESGVPQLVAASERMAINMPIQGTESDIVKLAMIAVDGWLKKSGWPAQLLLQVHDELVVECDKEAVDAVAKGMKEMMESVANYEVPLDVEVEVGASWGQLKPWKN